MIERGDLSDALRLTVITDPDCGAGRSITEVVAAALEGGARCIQLRAKESTAREMVALGRKLRELTLGAGALLIVNDRLDVALAIGADGVHLGDDDLPVGAVRRAVPPGLLIGRSADSEDIARTAERDGADYLGVGPIFPTTSKPDAGAAAGIGLIERIVAATRLPVVGIGGIEPESAADIVRAGAAGVAVIRAVMCAGDPAVATADFLAAMDPAAFAR